MALWVQKFGPRINASLQGNSSPGNTRIDTDVAQRKVGNWTLFCIFAQWPFYHYVGLSKFEYIGSESSFFIILNFVAFLRVKLT